jgi:hypothetical protein
VSFVVMHLGHYPIPCVLDSRSLEGETRIRLSASILQRFSPRDWWGRVSACTDLLNPTLHSLGKRPRAARLRLIPRLP